MRTPSGKRRKVDNERPQRKMENANKREPQMKQRKVTNENDQRKNEDRKIEHGARQTTSSHS